MSILVNLLSKVVTQKMMDEAIAKALRDTRTEEATKESLKTEIATLKDTLENLKLTEKIERRDIEHMVKVKEEKNQIELERKTVELEGKFQKDKMELVNENHRKALELIEGGKKELKEIYGEIIKRLPNVNMELSRKVK